MANYINGAAIGVAQITSDNPTIEQTTAYDEITFYGGSSGCVVDRIHGLNRAISQSDINKCADYTQSLYWTYYTYLLAEFSQNLVGGNVTQNNLILNWLIYRINNTDASGKLIAELSSDAVSYNDFTAQRLKNYTYQIIGRNNDETSPPIVSSDVDCDYWGWWLIDPDNNTAYSFELNFEGGELSQNEEVNNYTTNQKFKVFSRSNLDSLSGTITALVPEVVEEWSQDVDFLESLREFIKSNRTKIIKDAKGRVFKVFTSGWNESDFAYNTSECPRTISFSFEQIGELE